MKNFFEKHPALATGIRLFVISLFALAITVPFAKQSFSLDGPLVVDYARMQAEHPLQQHLDDYDYFGVRYDEFFNTHPRFLSFYLSLVVRLFGASEVPVHLALTVFPVIGGIGMFYLGRRFGVSGMAAALFFIAAPAAMVSSHMEMVDIPGTCLWVASLAAFIYGVDRRSIRLLSLSSILFVLTIFTFYQGLSALALAIFYLIMKKRLALWNLAAVLAPVLAFGIYLALFYRGYGEFPRFSYRIPLIGYDRTFTSQLRGALVVIGGTLLFPLAMPFLFIRNWRILLAGLFAAAGAWPWLYVRYDGGYYSIYETLALGLFAVSGIIVCYAALEQAAGGFAAWFRRKDNDILLPAAWFTGVLVYCVAFLAYPSPRYLLPAWPPLVIIMLRLWRGTLARRPSVRAAMAASVFALTLVFSTLLSIAYYDYARESRESADEAFAEYGGGGRVWFSGELGYAYYMRQHGATVVPGVLWHRYSRTSLAEPGELPAPGDVVIGSGLAGNWLPYPDVLPYLRVRETIRVWTGEPVIVWTHDNRSSWNTSLLLPFQLAWRPVDVEKVTVWDVAGEPQPLLPEVQEEVDRWN